MRWLYPPRTKLLLVQKLIADEGLKSGIVRRRSAWVVYIKDADNISQFLALLGATRSMLQYEDIRVQKTVKSSVLRQMNMDKANLSRSVESCLKQIEDILLIEREIGLHRLPKALREIAEARLNNQALTMEEPGTGPKSTYIEIGGKPPAETDCPKSRRLAGQTKAGAVNRSLV